MKKWYGLLIIVISYASADMKYECNRYVNGECKGFTYVVAKNKAEAEHKALIKFKDNLSKKVDYVKCK
jgi:hypothetical protein